jgi:hypothetical protein
MDLSNREAAAYWYKMAAEVRLAKMPSGAENASDLRARRSS